MERAQIENCLQTDKEREDEVEGAHWAGSLASVPALASAKFRYEVVTEPAALPGPVPEGPRKPHRASPVVVCLGVWAYEEG